MQEQAVQDGTTLLDRTTLLDGTTGQEEQAVQDGTTLRDGTTILDGTTGQEPQQPGTQVKNTGLSFIKYTFSCHSQLSQHR